MQLRSFRINKGRDTPVTWAGSQAAVYSTALAGAVTAGQVTVTLVVSNACHCHGVHASVLPLFNC